MVKTVDELLDDKDKIRPLVQQLLDEGLVLVENPHEDGKKPHHSFYMSKTTVSQALWKALMGENPSVYLWDDRRESRRYPVDDVFLEDCLAFIRVLNERPEVRKRKLVFRLPRRSEWRFASRAGGASYQSGKYVCAQKGVCFEAVAWYKGNRWNFFATSRNVPNIVKVDSNGRVSRVLDSEPILGPRPMGILMENDFHLHDMFGNLWEWTLEKGATQGELWGGSWADGPEACTWVPR